MVAVSTAFDNCRGSTYFQEGNGWHLSVPVKPQKSLQYLNRIGRNLSESCINLSATCRELGDYGSKY